jgi:hypothetical protein
VRGKLSLLELILRRQFRGVILPVALIGLVGVNALLWRRYHVNYMFIFEIDPRDPLTVWAILRVC